MGKSPTIVGMRGILMDFRWISSAVDSAISRVIGGNSVTIFTKLVLLPRENDWGVREELELDGIPFGSAVMKRLQNCCMQCVAS